MADTRDQQPGAIFGRDFRIVRTLRAGGMGAVYIVDQLSTGKPRALKVMSSDFVQSPAARERFVLEARAASRIESDHVVEIVTAGIDEASGAPFLVMELLRGEELADTLDRVGPLSLTDVADVLSQIGHALEQAHAQGIVHRDIKPENIFLAASKRRDGSSFTAKVLDFGIAKIVADSSSTGTQALGTPLFMAPEQTDRKGRISPASDVWALGLLAFRMLTGRDFWAAADETLAMLLREICVDPIPFATVRAREMGVDRYLPPGFDAWFAQCVARDAAARFPEAGSAVRAFTDLVGPSSTARRLVIEAPPLNVGSTYTRPGAQESQGVGRSPAGWSAPPPSPPPQLTPLPPPPPRNPAVTATPGPIESSRHPTSASALPVPAKKPAWVFVLPAAVAIAIGGGLFFVLRLNGRPPPSPGGAPVAGSAGASEQATSGAPSASGAAPAGTAGTIKCPEGTVVIPGGKMFMGARDLTPDSKPPHEVVVSAFCIDRTEVTTSAYMACVAGGECERPLDKVSWPGIQPQQVQRYSPFCNAAHQDRGDHPVNCVAWAMADTYCRKKGARLPSEAEWEFAARGMTQRKYPWGEQEPDEKRLNACGAECKAWGAANGEARVPMYAGSDGFAATAPAGSFPEGAATHGLMDMAGNVWEWTADWYAPYTEVLATDPKGPKEGTQRVVRGGDFFGSNPDWARPAYRWKTDPDTYNHAIGFRCAADPK